MGLFDRLTGKNDPSKDVEAMLERYRGGQIGDSIHRHVKLLGQETTLKGQDYFRIDDQKFKIGTYDNPAVSWETDKAKFTLHGRDRMSQNPRINVKDLQGFDAGQARIEYKGDGYKLKDAQGVLKDKEYFKQSVEPTLNAIRAKGIDVERTLDQKFLDNHNYHQEMEQRAQQRVKGQAAPEPKPNILSPIADSSSVDMTADKPGLASLSSSGDVTKGSPDVGPDLESPSL